ncbi:GDSL lipase/acylhydrolase family protein [Xylariales sp. PMI_506]|nr:GDSL lipase/acylhydrolase family protein [Xylariales sp. PMI_506]
MWIRTDSVLIVLFTEIAVASLARSHDFKFSALVVFGDSYTDQGVYSYTPDASGNVGVPKNATHTGGRVWPEYINQYSGARIYDYARSGAYCDATMAPSHNAVKQDQIPTFLADNSNISNNTGQPALDNPADQTVYAIWIGTNDIGNYGYLTEVQQPRGLPVTAYIDCVFEQLDRLYAVGARNLVLMNLAPLDLVPQYALPENQGLNDSEYWPDKIAYDANITKSSEKIRQYSTLANAVYEFRVPYEVTLAKRYPGSWFALFDVHSLFSDIWNSPSLYLNGTVPLNVEGYVKECLNTTCASPSAWDSYMWYDELHPSEQTDRILAAEFLEVVNGRSKWAKYWTN